MIDVPTLSPGQVRTLLDYIQDANGTPAKQLLGRRNHTITLLMLDAGLRSNEVRLLNVYDLYWQGTPRQTLEVRSEIAKYAVGGLIPISPRLYQSLVTYAHDHPTLLQQAGDLPLFPGHDPTGRLTTRQLRRILHHAGEIALGRHVWCHLCRHTFGDTLRRVTDLPTAQTLMRHRDIRSTMVYTHPDQADKTAAIAAAAARQQETTP